MLSNTSAAETRGHHGDDVWRSLRHSDDGDLLNLHWLHLQRVLFSPFCTVWKVSL